MGTRQQVKFFVSYARANKDLAVNFLSRFKDQTTPSKRYEYSLWQDSEILVGEKWNDEIKAALGQAQIGLLLLSPAFLGSQYIAFHELPAFGGQEAKPLMPIMLQPVDLEHHDLKGLQETQIFRLESPRFKNPKAFGECTSSLRDRFAQVLFGQVETRLGKLLGSKST